MHQLFSMFVAIISLLAGFPARAQSLDSRLNGATRFLCTPSTVSRMYGRTNEITDGVPSEIRILFSPDGQFQSAELSFSKPFMNFPKSTVMDVNNTQFSKQVGGDDPKYNPNDQVRVFITQSWNEKFSVALSYKTINFQGLKYTPYQSLVGTDSYQDINGFYEDGKLVFLFHNAQFPATWRNVFQCNVAK